MGKSALAAALARDAEARGARVVWGRAWELAEAPPYFPLRACLASLGITAIMNVPVRHAGRHLGTLNFCGDEGTYHEREMAIGRVLSSLLAPALLAFEVAMCTVAAAAGWLPAKLRGYRWLLRERRWLADHRRTVQRARRRSDRELSHLLTARFAQSVLPLPRGGGGHRRPHRAGGGLDRRAPWWRAVRALERTLGRAADARAHLFQIRRRQPGRQPQAELGCAAGVLQQAGRRETPRHRNRRGSVGLVAGTGLRILRTGMQGLHGACEL